MFGLWTEKAEKAARFTFHSLRHTAASFLIQSGVDLYTIKEIFGHGSIALTERYSHLANDALKEAAKKMPRLTTTDQAEQEKVEQEKVEIESWPDDLLADFARMVELLMDFGPNIGMPHSRPLGGGLFELRPRGRGGIGRAFYCFTVRRRIVVLHAFINNAGNPGASSADSPEKDEGGSEWIRKPINRLPMTMRLSSKKP